VRDELAWHAGELGAARDAEVLRDGQLEALDTLGTPAEAAERELISQSLHEAHQVAHAELRQTMTTARYDRLQESLAQWLVDPPLAAAGPVPAAPVLHGLLDRSRARVASGYLAALRAPDDPAGWHEVRKAAKAVRYCSEALEPVYGDRAGQHTAAWESVTDAFGELQDSVVARTAIVGFDRESPALAALLAYQVGRGRAALDAALAASL
jgi:CHAD domain-containing protein